MTNQTVALHRPGLRERRVAVRSPEDAQDRELVRRVGGGDEEAFRSLFRRYGPVAKALATRVIHQANLAEEIVQEAFLVLWRSPHSYREDRGTFRAWLMSMVHHRAVDMVRREEAHRRRSQPTSTEGIEQDVAQQVVDLTEMAASRGRLHAALGEIPPEQRQVLDLMYFDGKTQSAISNQLGLPLGTVKSRTLLAMRRLRTLLADSEDLT